MQVFEGKTYYWCPVHHAWTLHKPDECNKKSKREQEGTAGATSTTTTSTSNRETPLRAAMTTVMAHFAESDEE